MAVLPRLLEPECRNRHAAAQIAGKRAAEMFALLRGDLRERRQRRSVLAARERAVAQRIDVVEPAHRKIGIDGNAPGTVERHAEPLPGR